ERTELGKVNFVLARPNFAVRGLDLHTETSESIDHRAAQLFSARALNVEITTPIDRHQVAAVGARVAILEDVELELARDAVVKATLDRISQHPFECLTRIGGEGFAIRQAQVADQARGRRRLPRQDYEAAWLGPQEQITFGNASETFDRRAIEPGAVIEHPR